MSNRMFSERSRFGSRTICGARYGSKPGFSTFIAYSPAGKALKLKLPSVPDAVMPMGFALLLQLRGGRPIKRMEPIEGPDEFGTDLYRPVLTSNVREFVGEHDPPAVRRPFDGTGRKNDARPEDSPRDWHGCGIAALQDGHAARGFQ